VANEARPPQDGAERELPFQDPPTFINPPETQKTGGGEPRMVFTGPVFIGYPIEQAMALMQQWKSTQ